MGRRRNIYESPNKMLKKGKNKVLEQDLFQLTKLSFNQAVFQ